MDSEQKILDRNAFKLGKSLRMLTWCLEYYLESGVLGCSSRATTSLKRGTPSSPVDKQLYNKTSIY